MEKKRKTIGLALGSGSDRGMSHIGVIKTLLKHNIPIDYISGTSIGAIVGAYYALHLEVDGIEKTFKNIMPRPWYFFDFSFKEPFLSEKNIYNMLSYNFYREKTFSDTKIPLRINATDIDDGSQYVFKNGKIIDAVISSMSIPGIFSPYLFNKRHLVDGGLSNAIPVDLLSEFNPDVVIAVDLYTTKIEPLPNYSRNNIINRAYQIYFAKLSEFSKNNFCKHCKNFIVLNPDTRGRLSEIPFKNIDKNIQIGVEETERNIEEIKKLCL